MLIAYISNGVTPPGAMPPLPVIAPVAPDGDEVAAVDGRVVGPEAGPDAPQTPRGEATGEAPNPPDGEADPLGTTAPCFCGAGAQLTRNRPMTTIPTPSRVARNPALRSGLGAEFCIAGLGSLSIWTLDLG